MPHKLVHNYSQLNSTGRPASVRGVRRIMQPEYGVKNPQLPALWSKANELDPGEPPEHLEALGPLTPLEEWLIAPVHTRMQVMTYRGAQYVPRSYRQLISFPKNVPTMHYRLSVPPGQLNILILRPRKQTDQPNTINRFRIQLHVRRPVVAAWLRHLQANHDGYSEVTIDEDFLSQLPDDGDVNADLRRRRSYHWRIRRYIPGEG
ncbi:hypothetical protein E4U45_004310 [Claviceps purpurea]|nr:hypothetical protein E4U45_004310 [Claviceps purpurea]